MRKLVFFLIVLLIFMSSVKGQLCYGYYEAWGYKDGQAYTILSPIRKLNCSQFSGIIPSDGERFLQWPDYYRGIQKEFEVWLQKVKNWFRSYIGDVKLTAGAFWRDQDDFEFLSLDEAKSFQESHAKDMRQTGNKVFYEDIPTQWEIDSYPEINSMKRYFFLGLIKHNIVGSSLESDMYQHNVKGKMISNSAFYDPCIKQLWAGPSIWGSEVILYQTFGENVGCKFRTAETSEEGTVRYQVKKNDEEWEEYKEGTWIKAQKISVRASNNGLTGLIVKILVECNGKCN